MDIIENTFRDKEYFQKLKMEASPGTRCFISNSTDTKQIKTIRNIENSHTDPGLSLTFVGGRARVHVKVCGPLSFFSLQGPSVPHYKEFQPGGYTKHFLALH